MRTTALTKSLPLILLLMSCNRSSKLEYADDRGQDQEHTIVYLKSLCTKNSVAVTKDITIRGFVTANDFWGEFYKMLVIEDATGGISISIDGSNLAEDYPVGTAVVLYCNGLTLGDYGGKIQIGTAPDGDYSVGRIPFGELERYVRKDPAAGKILHPTTLTFDAIGSRHTDTFVRFDNVRFAEAGAWCDTDPETREHVTTERLLIDQAGRTFVVRTSGTVTYAALPVPSGTGNVCGIIDYFNRKYTLRISNYKIEFPNAEGLPTAYP